MELSDKVRELLNRGVLLPCPAAVEISDDVKPARIASGVTIHAGCRISGSTTSIGPGSRIGAEAPATIEDCQLGKGVELKGGYFSGATFLDGANMGSGAHVRPGTLLEEEANGAHAVAFKQTILLSYVTAGSLINFCDCLMAGGTSRKNHSEIGSSYIHFNYTPHQDKATPSLIGDVPRGVMLDQPAIFLGGQGGLVGPVRLEYGTVIPAGVICRKDQLKPNSIFVPPSSQGQAPRSFIPGAYRAIQRIVSNNLIYIGNLHALKLWYRHARKATMNGDAFGAACYEGALARIDSVIKERNKRLQDLAQRMPKSLEYAKKECPLPAALQAQQQALIERWPDMEKALKAGPSESSGASDRDRFLAAWEQADLSKGHTQAVESLPSDARKAGAAWLQAVVDSTASLWKPI